MIYQGMSVVLVDEAVKAVSSCEATMEGLSLLLGGSKEILASVWAQLLKLLLW